MEGLLRLHVTLRGPQLVIIIMALFKVESKLRW
jgi:hypothetical protein